MDVAIVATARFAISEPAAGGLESLVARGERRASRLRRHPLSPVRMVVAPRSSGLTQLSPD